LSIRHDGSNSYLQDAGSGDLIIKSNGTNVKIIGDNDEDIAKFTWNGSTELYHNGSKKIETTATGVAVTGGLNTTGPLTSESAAATNIVAKSTNGNGGYMNYQGLASNGTQTFAVNHNGTIFTTSGLAVGGTGAANTLSDYETGSWTPSLTGTTGGTVSSYNNRAGRYIKIGNQVTVWFYFHTASVSSMSGTAKINGLPFSFTSDMANNAGMGTVSAYYLNQSSLRDITLVRAGDGAIGLLGSLSTNGITGNASWANVAATAFTATALQGVFTYRSS